MPVFRFLAVAAALFLAACAAPEDPAAPPPELGDFRLGHNIVVGETARMVPPSRSATAQEWEAALGAEIGKRLGRYQGEGLYHLGVSVDAYALAIPGVPVVVKPRSVVVFSVTVWDNATGRKINVDPKQLTAFENLGLSGESLIGSGITQSREEQIQNLSASAARGLQRWLVENKDWFSGGPAVREAARAAAAVARKPGQPNPN